MWIWGHVATEFILRMYVLADVLKEPNIFHVPTSKWCNVSEPVNNTLNTNFVTWNM